MAEEYGYLAALKTELTAELIREGLAREFVRRVQTLRKDADFEISDRITISYQAGAQVRAAVEAHQEYIRAETLAEALREGPPEDSARSEAFEFDGESVVIGVRRV